MKSIVRMGGAGKRSRPGMVGAEAELNGLDSRVELIQALIPLGLEAVQELLQQEVMALAGERYRHLENGELLAQGQVLGSKGCVAKDERAE